MMTPCINLKPFGCLPKGGFFSLRNTRDTSVHLDNGEFWCNKASTYKGKSHRVIFEESMEKIYKNMYRNASSPHSSRSSYNF